MAKFKSVSFRIVYGSFGATPVAFKAKLEIEFEEEKAFKDFLDNTQIKIKNKTFYFMADLRESFLASTHLPLSLGKDEIPSEFQKGMIAWLKAKFPEAYDYENGIKFIAQKPTIQNPAQQQPPQSTTTTTTTTTDKKPQQQPTTTSTTTTTKPQQQPSTTPKTTTTTTNATKPQQQQQSKPSTQVPNEPLSEKPKEQKNKLINSIKLYFRNLAQRPGARRFGFHVRLFCKIPTRYPRTMGFLSGLFALAGSLYFLSLGLPAAICCAIAFGGLVTYGTILRNFKYEEAANAVAAMLDSDEQNQAYENGQAAAKGWVPYLKSTATTGWIKEPSHYGAGLINGLDDLVKQEQKAWEEAEFKRNYPS